MNSWTDINSIGTCQQLLMFHGSLQVILIRWHFDGYGERSLGTVTRSITTVQCVAQQRHALRCPPQCTLSRLVSRVRQAANTSNGFQALAATLLFWRSQTAAVRWLAWKNSRDRSAGTHQSAPCRNHNVHAEPAEAPSPPCQYSTYREKAPTCSARSKSINSTSVYRIFTSKSCVLTVINLIINEFAVLTAGTSAVSFTRVQQQQQHVTTATVNDTQRWIPHECYWNQNTKCHSLN